MFISIDPAGTIEGLVSLLEEMLANDEVKGLLILACDENNFATTTINHVLEGANIPLFGGIFPGIIHGRETLHRGTIVAGLSCTPDIHVAQGLSSEDLDFEKVMGKISPERGDKKTMFVFVDGYSQRISSLIDNLYTILGLQYTYIGGGAGSINPSALDMSKTPCLFTNNGLIKDSALLVVIDMKCGVGAKHGWHKISGPYKVTESIGNTIKTLDWRPAFEVYKKIIQEHCGEIITEENFFDVAKRFPFGMSRLGSEIIVRDPFTVEEDSLIVATEIPQESFIDVLTGNSESLVSAAKKSYNEAKESFSGTQMKTTFIVDCISRALFLGDDFAKEVDAVSEESSQVIGVLSLGEIANSGKSYMELYNKTCVVGILGDP